MTKNVHMLPPQIQAEKSKSSRFPRLFLATMLIWGGLSGIFLPPGNDGMMARAAVRIAQEVEQSLAHVKHVVP